MAQVIAPEVWQQGLDDNRLLPGRYTTGLFTGKGVNIANNGEACRIWDIQTSDYITDYDDRRINGLSGKNAEGRDGWGASAYGVFQDVRFDSRVYTMGRHRSTAWRIFEEMQYSGDIGEWGSADGTTSNVITNGENLMKVAAMISKARELWEKQVLGPDIDRYNLFAILNGHISGRWVQDNPDEIFNDQGHWVAQPGMVQGQAIPPRFAPIHAIEWDDENLPLFLQNVKVTWNELFIEQTNRVICIDPHYEYKLLSALTGKGVPATDSAYNDLQNGSFTRLMGWDFNFEIPSEYWPHLYLDDNLNVVHSPDGKAAYDAIINSYDGGDNPDLKLERQLVAADRMNRPNFVKTIWNNETGEFEKVVTNYPLGLPSKSPYLGAPIKQDIDNYDSQITGEGYPWTGPGAGYGLSEPTGPVGEIVRRQVIGMALYKPAAQLSQEYSNMVTDEGRTRGKFTECCFDVKYDAWVIESLSHGILPIIDAIENTGQYAIPVEVVPEKPDPTATITGIKIANAPQSLDVGQEATPIVTVEGTGKFDKGYTAMSENVAVATIDANGKITAVGVGQTTITYRSIGDPTVTNTVTVRVNARD